MKKRGGGPTNCMLQKAGTWKDHGRVFVHLGVSLYALKANAREN